MKTPDYMREPEKIECINCGWQGQRDYLEDGRTCPHCECEDYIIECEDDEEPKQVQRITNHRERFNLNRAVLDNAPRNIREYIFYLETNQKDSDGN